MVCDWLDIFAQCWMTEGGLSRVSNYIMFSFVGGVSLVPRHLLFLAFTISGGQVFIECFMIYIQSSDITDTNYMVA